MNGFSITENSKTGSQCGVLRTNRNLQSAIICFLFTLLALVLSSPFTIAQEPRAFQEGKFLGGQLRYINDLPVLIVSGTPQEMGRQKAALTGDVVLKLSDYPQKLLQLTNRGEERWQKLLEMSESLRHQIPHDYREELRAFAVQAGIKSDWDMGVMGNVLVDIYRGGLNCSSLIVEASRSASGGPLFGHNLDFYTLGMLDKYSLVTVHRPKGKHAFAAVGFPGLFGCLSGMNDAGLALEVHEGFLANDGAPSFKP